MAREATLAATRGEECMTSMAGRIFTVDTAQDGQRLDKVLAGLLPEWGLRARRRLWDKDSETQVLVNDRPRPPGYTVVAGDEVELRGGASKATVVSDAAVAARTASAAAAQVLPVQDFPRLVEARNGLLFFHKPAGLHSAALPGGRGGASLEDCLASLVPADMATPALHLLNRLDCGTSGLVVAATDADAALRWHEAEDAGRCRKTYLALLTGTLTEPITVTRALDTHHRRVTRVLRVKKPASALRAALEQSLGQEAPPMPDLLPDPAQEAPPLRHTVIEPVLSLRVEDMVTVLPGSSAASSPMWRADQPLTVALCRIRKGVRHQIRAHAAHAGFPLWGDVRYGDGGEDSPLGDDGHFVLHHGMLETPDGTVFDTCPWLALLPEKIANDIKQSLKKNNFLS